MTDIDLLVFGTPTRYGLAAARLTPFIDPAGPLRSNPPGDVGPASAGVRATCSVEIGRAVTAGRAAA